MVKPFGRINADLEWPHTSAKTFASKRVSKISQSRSSSLSFPLGPVQCCEHSIDMKTGLSICVLVTEGENAPRVHR